MSTPDLKKNQRVAFLLKLANVAWRDFDKRRSFEWKVNFALWPALGAFAGFLFTHPDSASKVVAVVGIVLVAVIGIIYAFVWTPGIRHHNRLDQEAAHHYWAAVDKVLEVESPKVRKDFTETLNLSTEEKQLEKYSLRAVRPGWSHRSQIAFTMVLLGLAGLGLGLARAAGWL